MYIHRLSHARLAQQFLLFLVVALMQDKIKAQRAERDMQEAAIREKQAVEREQQATKARLEYLEKQVSWLEGIISHVHIVYLREEKPISWRCFVLRSVVVKTYTWVLCYHCAEK